MRRQRSTLVSLALGVSLTAVPLQGQDEHAHHHGGGHGMVRFPVSCGSQVQADFDRAVAILHSFGYEEARQDFRTIAERSATCGPAFWGVAMTYFHPLWAPPTPEELAAGREAAEQAARIGAQTEREKDYIEAINAFYRDADRLDHPTRARAYRDAMRRLADRFPKDDEAKIFHALAVLGAAPPSDPTYTTQKRAAAVFTDLLPRYPGHPGIAHYTIHAFDYPALAKLALPAARTYADLAPESPHALHMPTHIFTRLGMWEESISSNHACVRAAKGYVAKAHPGAASFEALHCQDYLAYAMLQLGRNDQAREVLEEAAAAHRFDDPNFAVGYALLAIPARYALERRDWKAAAALKMPEVELRWENFRQVQALTHFANAIGAARSGDVEGAQKAVTKLGELRSAVASSPPSGPYDWAGRVDAMRRAAAGWLAFAQGHPDEAVQLLTAAAETEETVGKHAVTPGPVLPARELLGDLLLELGRPAEALAAYEASLTESPRRLNGIAGAARAARAADERGRAAAHYRALVELIDASSSARRAELEEARGYLSGGRGG